MVYGLSSIQLARYLLSRPTILGHARHIHKVLVSKIIEKEANLELGCREIFDGYVPGEGVYISDGVYVSLSTWAIMQGFTPMWKSDGRGL